LNILKAAALTAVYILLINLAGLWSWPLEVIGMEWHFSYYDLFQAFFQFIAIVVLLFVILKCSKTLFIQPIESKWIFIAALAGGAFVFLQAPLKWAYNLCFQTDNPSIVFNFDGLRTLNILNFLATALLIPIGEELYFRGFIQGRILKDSKPAIALITAASMFALLHSPYPALLLADYQPDWLRCYITFFGGLLSGLLYFKTKSILPSIMFHVMWNIAAQLF